MSSTPSVALITGAAHRIGAEIARQLHAEGYTIIVHYCHSVTAASQLAAELNQLRAESCQLLQADLLDTDAAIQLAQDALQLYGHLDVLINNASSFYPTPLPEATPQDWDRLFNSNLKGAYFLCQQLADSLGQRHGCIVNMVDIYSERPMKNHSLYCMAKAGLAMMTKALAKELAPAVRVNGVSPGAILWPEDELSEAKKAAILDRVPMKTLGSSNDIASTVVFLVRDAPFITGHIIAVDGGRSVNM